MPNIMIPSIGTMRGAPQRNILGSINARGTDSTTMIGNIRFIIYARARDISPVTEFVLFA